MYVLLHGAKRNVGDFLIFERAKALIEAHCADSEYVVLPRWKSLDENFDTVNRSNGVFLCGGPGYQQDFYPAVFPFASDLSQLKPPIIPLGLGWGVGNKLSTANTFRFSEQSYKAIHLIHSRITSSSVRDEITRSVLKSIGVDNVVMTGCPAWYSIPHVSAPYVPLTEVRRIVLSTPANTRNFVQLARLLPYVNRLFPSAKKFLSFHRGINRGGPHSSKREIVLNSSLAIYGKRLGYEIADVAYDTRKIQFYEECDLHIGYRVHAHIAFLSLRKPSILIQEDARGNGQSSVLHTQDIDSYSGTWRDDLLNTLQKHLDTGFGQFQETYEVMREKYDVMVKFLQQF